MSHWLFVYRILCTGYYGYWIQDTGYYGYRILDTGYYGYRILLIPDHCICDLPLSCAVWTIASKLS